MLIGNSFPHFKDSDGSPLNAGYIYFGTVNLNPETNPITVYWDSALTQPAAQPIRTLNGFVVRDGRISNLYCSSTYSVTVKNKNGILLISLMDSSAFDINAVLPAQLAASSGSNSIGHIRSESGATATTVKNKLLENPSVLDFGAVGNGIADDTAAFTAAQTAASFIKVPYGLICKVSPGLNYWKFYGEGSVFENGRQWDLSKYAQTSFAGKFYKERTWGTYESAVGRTVTINSGVAQTKENTQVLGTNTQGLAQVYTDRDHVADYISAYSYVPDVLDNTSTYSSTTLTNSAISGLYSSDKIKPGMIIDTNHAIICTGTIQSISGNVITVDAWYARSGGGATTPANGTGCIINPNNKIFGQNIVVGASGNGTTTGAQKFSGVEMDLSTPASGSPISGTWGYDMAVTGGYIDIGYQIRGKRNISFFSNNAGGAGLYGFRSVGDNRGLSIQDAAIPIEVITGAQGVFSVNSAGRVSILDGFIKYIGPLQTTNSFVNLGDSWTTGRGALFYITGYNVGTGAEGKFLFAANNTSSGQIYNSDGSGCTVAFQILGSNLQIKATTGTFQFTAFQLSI